MCVEYFMRMFYFSFFAFRPNLFVCLFNRFSFEMDFSFFRRFRFLRLLFILPSIVMHGHGKSFCQASNLWKFCFFLNWRKYQYENDESPVALQLSKSHTVEGMRMNAELEHMKSPRIRMSKQHTCPCLGRSCLSQ